MIGPRIGIAVEYSCHHCGLRNIEVLVRFRAADENVVHWVSQAVALAIGDDHRTRSPFCRAREISETKIPLPPGTERVGAPVKQ